ncbi:MAG: diacylglycerol kinase [Thiobacillaceae bacterium]|nr:diacylglycerol kinase [Thiobacillaceae bacterium]
MRLWNATGYSRDGIAAAWKHEAAFREEVLLAAITLPLAFYLGITGIERALMAGSILLSPERHELAKRAKDMGSAAVLLSLMNAAVVWACVLWPGSR